MPLSLRHQLGIGLVAGFVFFTHLGTPALWDRDEPRNAGCAEQMWKQGEWIVPTFNGELRAHKPALLYWFMMSAYSVFGPGEFAARFWSAAFGVGTCLLTYQIGRRLFSAHAGVWAALALATSLNFGIVARAATPDSVYIFFSTAALAVFAFGVVTQCEVRAPRILEVNRRTLAAAYVLMGIAVLAKGPIGVLLPGFAQFLFLLYAPLPRMDDAGGHRSRWQALVARLGAPWRPGNVAAVLWSQQPLLAIAIVGAIALPWYVAVGARTEGSFLATFFGEHNVGRFVRPMEGHSGPIFYYLIAVLVGFFPWSCFAGSMCAGWWQRVKAGGPERMAAIFVACWAGAYLGFFSLAGTKLPSYVLPAYPALALIAGAFLKGLLAGRFDARRYWAPVSFACLAFVGLGLVIGAVVVVQRYLPGEWALVGIGVAPLAAGLASLWLLQQNRLPSALGSFAAGAVLLAVGVLGFGAARVDQHQVSRPLMAQLRAKGAAGASLGAFGALEPSWVYYSGRAISWLQTAEQMAAFLRVEETPYVITTTAQLELLPGGLPPGLAVLAHTPQFLRPGDLVIVGRASELARWSAPSEVLQAELPTSRR
ncbi:MAG: glycosyltransferase family 39 protein [Pirellulales bacterium]